MTTRKSYSDKLKSPFWQKKRLEILERDQFRCRGCHSESNTLHVHHSHYRKNADPWDYDNSNLVSLCSDCHKEIELNRERVLKYCFNDLNGSRLMLSIAKLWDLEGCHRRGETAMDARFMELSDAVSHIADLVKSHEDDPELWIDNLESAIDCLYEFKFSMRE